MNTKKDNELKCYALNFWANWIETDDMTMSAENAVKCDRRDKMNVLTLEQVKLVIRLRELAIKELNDER